MIRAGRVDKVRTLADLAAQQGLSLGRYQVVKPYAEEGFPAPVSSDGARTLLFDADQVDAHLAGAAVPELPSTDSDEDLLDRSEAAAELGSALTGWSAYKKRPALADHTVVVAGVEHWPRGIIRAYRDARTSRPATGGRPRNAGDQIPRDQLLSLTAPLLDADPAITAARVTETLGVHRDTAQRALTHLRAGRIADRLATDPNLTPHQAAAELGYPTGQVRTAVHQALTELRARAAGAYLATVTAALNEAGLTATPTAPDVEQNRDTLRTAVLLTPEATPAALVWEDGEGWRTATRRLTRTPPPEATPSSPTAPNPAPPTSWPLSPPDTLSQAPKAPLK
ncbi:hypothetical protein [Streptomyces sp. NPDC093795]|uniref:hypothetical protein n=1 Tax=Streptomyces sp. NPDC093795 TaxID=3366051 RepID=UPI003830581D